MIKTNRLSGKIKEANLTQRDLAPLMEISEHTLSRKMKGHVDFSLGEVIHMVDFLKLSPEETFDIFFSQQ